MHHDFSRVFFVSAPPSTKQKCVSEQSDGWISYQWKFTEPCSRFPGVSSGVLKLICGCETWATFDFHIEFVGKCWRDVSAELPAGSSNASISQVRTRDSTRQLRQHTLFFMLHVWVSVGPTVCVCVNKKTKQRRRFHGPEEHALAGGGDVPWTQKPTPENGNWLFFSGFHCSFKTFTSVSFLICQAFSSDHLK